MTDGGTDATAAVTAAADAAHEVVFSRYDRTDVDDVDVTVSFEDDELTVEVILEAPGDADRVADDAALAARSAADDLLD
ncbi:DUF3194 domain-containing protein [Halococcoides cellulosivorans]|uniref:DUF3194 domain-containing protein n=1 Tax=Halococcoides cellulosivorans TaxID=1679096 RepID=A0A2R4WZM4_9EURY|nr:DUF3194 domain-containing protein [Halococcoides cellulosivorans]AWB26979.1 DUF3194 domain-containing protein [Halococcoides cellulosivorans]